MLTNVRMPDQNYGDLQAQIAAMNTGERKVHDMVRKFGVEVFRQGVKDLLDLGERQARALLSRIPDGDYFFADYLDEDAPGGVPVRLALTLKIRGDEAILDFSGSDAQLQSSLNVPTGGAERHILLMVGYTYCLYSIDPTILLNGGITRPARCIIPEGTILNPQFPAAVGMRSMTCGRAAGCDHRRVPGSGARPPAGRPRRRRRHHERQDDRQPERPDDHGLDRPDHRRRRWLVGRRRRRRLGRQFELPQEHAGRDQRDRGADQGAALWSGARHRRRRQASRRAWHPARVQGVRAPTPW